MLQPGAEKIVQIERNSIFVVLERGYYETTSTYIDRNNYYDDAHSGAG